MSTPILSFRPDVIFRRKANGKIYMHILFGHFQNNVKTGYFLEITACSPVEKSVECVYNYLYVMQISVDSVDRFPSKMKFH